MSFLEAQQHRNVAPFESRLFFFSTAVATFHWFERFAALQGLVGFDKCSAPAGYCCNVGDKDCVTASPGGSGWVEIFHPPIWCFQKWWYPTTIGFPTKNDPFGVFWGYHYFWKHPIDPSGKTILPKTNHLDPKTK